MSAPLRVVELARASDTGLVRGHNEDRFTAVPPLLAVADGMGGAQAGEVAAQVAVDRLEALGEPTDPDRLRAAVEDANREIREMAAANPTQAGMGTTLTAALLRDGRAELVHVGDSRAYLLRDGALHQITDDHSLVAELVRRGELAPEQAERHPHRNVITRALGAEPEVVVDRVDVDLAEDDVLLLCTDGLTAYVSEALVLEVLAAATSLQEAADRLVESANRAGGVDNTTVVLARIGRVDPAAVAPTLAMPAVAAADGEAPADATAEIPVPVGDAAEADEAPAPPAEDAPVDEPAETRAADAPDEEPETEPRPIRMVRVPDSPRPAPPARVLERVSQRRSRVGPILIGVVILLLLVGGGVAWIGSRTYFVETAGDGTVRVAHGFPWSPLGIDLSGPWQETGVGAAAVRAAEPGALDRSARGQGEAVELAARLTWRYGTASVTPLTAPPPPPPPPAAAGTAARQRGA
jgi:PPM family protein phosphatase